MELRYIYLIAITIGYFGTFSKKTTGFIFGIAAGACILAILNGGW